MSAPPARAPEGPLGAWEQAPGRFGFRLWAPGARSVDLLLDDRVLPMAREPDGCFALEANAGRFVARQAAGERLGAEVSMLKMRGSRLIQLWEELIVDALGPEAMPLSQEWLAGSADAAPRDALAGTASSRRFLARGYTIAGGSSEIQHNILAKQVLAL